MIALTSRSSATVVALVTLLVASPLARLEAQAAAITMPKQAAQRAAAASNAQLQGQMNQAQSAQASPTTAAPGSAQSSAQAPASGQQRGATPAVVQSGASRAGAPDPGSTAGPAPGAAAPDPANTLMREVFDYTSEGRRDPFFSLMATGDIRPMLSDLRLTTILYDPTGRRPVAVMNDITSNLQYRVTTGMMLGRMRVTQIKPRAVIFAIEEFGFSRADSILLADKPQTRK